MKNKYLTLLFRRVITFLLVTILLISASKNILAQCTATGTGAITTSSAYSSTGIGTGTITSGTVPQIAINADMEIDQNLTLQGCSILMNAGVLITVDAGVTLDLDGCTVQTCGNFLFDGFYLDDDATKQLIIENGSLISDMQYGIFSHDGGHYNISGSTISDSYMAIHADDYAGTHPGTVTGTLFQGTTALNSNSSGTGSSTAIYFESVSGSSPSTSSIQVGDNTLGGNTFDTWEVGILSRETNLISESNSFTNIADINTSSVYHAAIWVKGAGNSGAGGNLICDKNSFTYSDAIGILIDASIANTITVTDGNFNHVDNDNIYATGSDFAVFDIDGTDFSNSTARGVAIETCPFATIGISNGGFDYIEDKNIYLTANGESTTTIEANTFDHFGATVGNKICIHCEDNDDGSGYTTITIDNANRIQNSNNRRAIVCEEAAQTDYVDLTIEGNTIAYVRQGIFIQNIHNAKVDENEIEYSYSTATNNARAYGIALFNSDGSSISGSYTTPQTVTGDDNTSILGAGIFVQSSENVLINQNTVSTAGYGIEARFNCTGTNFLCNDLEDCANGFFLTQINTNMGSGLLELGPIGASGTPADNVWGYTSTWSGNEINCNTNTLGANGTWYNVDAGCTGTTCGSPCAWFIPSTNIGTNFGIAMALTQDCSSQTCSPAYSGRGPSDMRDELLFAIVSADTWQSYSNGTEGDFYNDREKAYGYLLQHPEWLDQINGNDGYYADFMNAMSGSNTAIIAEAKALLHSNNVEDAAVLLDNLEPTNTPEENWKIVLEVYSVTYAIGITSLNEEQFETLSDIATQKVRVGGLGVYAARMMTGIEYDDGDNEEVKYEFTDIVSNSSAYPNPVTDGTVCFHLPANDEKQVTISITDIYGRTCLVETKPTSNSCIEFPTNFSNGIYFFDIIGDNTGKTMLKGKVLIQ